MLFMNKYSKNLDKTPDHDIKFMMGEMNANNEVNTGQWKKMVVVGLYINFFFLLVHLDK